MGSTTRTGVSPQCSRRSGKDDGDCGVDVVEAAGDRIREFVANDGLDVQATTTRIKTPASGT
jgi:hypothetical protein